MSRQAREAAERRRCVGAVVGIVSYFKTRDREIPLGPFLSVGTVVVMLWGNAIMNWWVLGVMGLSHAPTIVSAGSGLIR